MNNQRERDLFDDVIRKGTPIWDNLYQVRCRFIDTMTLDEIEEQGIILSPNEKDNKATLNRLVLAYHNIDRIYENFERGAQMGFPKPEMLYEIYDIVVAYLDAYIAYLGETVNTRGPITDLLGLDRFAQKVLDLAYNHCGPRKTKNHGYMSSRSVVGTIEVSKEEEQAGTLHSPRKPLLIRFTSRDSQKAKKDENKWK